MKPGDRKFKDKTIDPEYPACSFMRQCSVREDRELTWGYCATSRSHEQSRFQADACETSCASANRHHITDPIFRESTGSLVLLAILRFWLPSPYLEASTYLARSPCENHGFVPFSAHFEPIAPKISARLSSSG